MPIPDYQDFMLPLLQAVADGEDHPMKALTQCLGDRFGLNDDERQQLIPSGQQTYLANRVSWARTYLKKAGLEGVLALMPEVRLLLSRFTSLSPLITPY